MSSPPRGLCSTLWPRPGGWSDPGELPVSCSESGLCLARADPGHAHHALRRLCAGRRRLRVKSGIHGRRKPVPPGGWSWSACSAFGGIVTFLWPGVTALVLVFFIGGWAIAHGIFEIIGAIQLRKEIETDGG